MCDKPLTFDLAQAEELAKVVKKTRRRFRRHAQLHRLSAGPAGPRDGAERRTRRNQRDPRLLHPGLAANPARNGNQKQAAWRTDPKKSGIAGCFGDIGTHAYNLGRYITGLIPDTISCNLKIFERRPGTRRLRHSGHPLRQWGVGTVTASQISHGRENDIWIEVDGTKGALEWHQEEPNKMIVAHERRSRTDLHARGRAISGHWRRRRDACPPAIPKAFFEAFANIYTAVYDDIVKRASGQKFDGAKQHLSQRRAMASRA